MPPRDRITMEFHVSRTARDLYGFDEELFSFRGNVIFANFHAARTFAQKINQKRDLISYPEQAVRAGQINALGLIDEIMHYVVALYHEQENRRAVGEALAWVDEKIGREEVDRALRQFADEFPPLAIYRREVDVETYLKGETEGRSHRALLLEELLMLWLANMNPAASPYLELFDDGHLEKQTAYEQIIAELGQFFETQPKFGPEHQNLVDMLRSPAIAVPHSLTGQLEYIRQRWGPLLGKYLYRLLSSLDLAAEEAKFAGLGPGPAYVYEFGGLEVEPERFSRDLDWMPRVVMLAKNAYVWLDQLSRKYDRRIQRLDQVPHEELDTLARWGFTSLWLIGVWERSKASKRIKQMCGNPEADASAYSLFDYQIAGDLGGEAAFQNLKDRAWQRGIRMAGDMVPNHVGIDGKWMVEHPDWFVALDHSPFPSYSFNGPNLSWDDRVGIYLEDHYYDRSDAAVVFKRVDHATGSERYVYHGNDGTSMPWNDTAQLNFLNPETREAVIQTILHVARKFPVIRFDAAMTLTKKHFQRLWFPEPGTGGAIPSRAEHGMTKEQFDQAMPKEFWREVVDRVAEEVPETLLLAEAFWLLEGFFVRTLGMHRVYNSAFMNMLKNEDNANYRSVMKNTLEFNPEILKRFVNFMNNPDEETAVAQFGKDDKYFGVCTLLVTLPGLPMFGHGQVEGFREKYGMEFRRAYWDEAPDPHLIARHEREIFPLMQRRHLFAEVENFLLYDVVSPEGQVNEDVFAYSNGTGDDRALVIYHNRYAETRAWVRDSVSYSVKSGPGDDRTLIRKTLGEGLGLRNDGRYFCIFRDHRKGLEYIRNSKELYEQGLYVELGAYRCQVFLDFREVEDNEWHQYAHLASYLNGRGVPDIEEVKREIFLQPVHTPFKELVNAEQFRRLMGARVSRKKSQGDAKLLDEVRNKIAQLLKAVKTFTDSDIDEAPMAEEIGAKLETILQLPALGDRLPASKSRKVKSALKAAREAAADDPHVWGVLLGWVFIHDLGKMVDAERFAEQSRSWIDEWLLGKVTAAALRDLGLDEARAWHAVAVIKALTSHQAWFDVEAPRKARALAALQNLLRDREIQYLVGVNRYQEVLWFNQEAFEELIDWLLIVAVVDAVVTFKEAEIPKAIAERFELIQAWKKAEKKSEYRVERLLDALKA